MSRAAQSARVDVDAVPAPAFGLADELAPFDGEWHAHRLHQLLYAAEGTLRLETEGAQWLLPPQRAAWIAAGTSHRVRAEGPVSLRTVYVARRLTPGPPEPCRVFAVTPLAREMILHAMRWGPSRGPRDPVAGPYFAALATLCQEWAAEPLPFRLPQARTPELARAMDYTLQHLSGAPTLEVAARAAGLSSRTLARRFQDEAQMSWRRFLGVARMLRAMELLSARGARISQTAFAVGFESLGAFTRAFQDFTGERPKDYRRRVASHGGRRPLPGVPAT